jgi:hypothetical protein
MDRAKYLLEKANQKRVLNVGSESGPLHEALGMVASELYGLDREKSANMVCDLDRDPLPLLPEVDLIIMGEVLEHLANPGRVLEQFKGHAPLLITVPNALGARMDGANEIVNRDHTCWYSYTTLKTLVERYGYEVEEWCWYNGKPYVAEGLIFYLRG